MNAVMQTHSSLGDHHHQQQQQQQQHLCKD
jgi:hypothetical protein